MREGYNNGSVSCIKYAFTIDLKDLKGSGPASYEIALKGEGYKITARISHMDAGPIKFCGFDFKGIQPVIKLYKKFHRRGGGGTIKPPKCQKTRLQRNAHMTPLNGYGVTHRTLSSMGKINDIVRVSFQSRKRYIVNHSWEDIAYPQDTQ